MAYSVQSFSLTDRAQIKRFVRFPRQLYTAYPNWVPKLDIEYTGSRWLGLKGLLDPNFHFHTEAQTRFLNVCHGSKVLGRVCVFIDPLYNRTHKTQTAFFGFFDCIDDVSVATLLFSHAVIWCQQAGATELLGPFNFTYHHTCGLLVEGFEHPNVIEMPYNPPYYQRLIEAQGLTKAKDLISYALSIEDNARLERLDKIAKRALEKLNISLRPIDPKHLQRDLRIFVKIYNDAWKDRWSFVPLSPEEGDDLAEALRPILDPDIFLFAESMGEPVAVAGAVPNTHDILSQRLMGQVPPDALRILALLTRKRHIRSARMMAFGIREDFRRKGVEALLFQRALRAAQKKGYTQGDVGWIHEDNDLMISTITSVNAHPYKRYRIFQRSL